MLLGVVAIATLAAALLHGPALAALGLIGAFVAPLLVSTDQPNYWALTIYIAVVTAAAFAMARLRRWRWLVAATTFFGVVWMLPGISDPAGASVSAHAAHVVLGFGLAAVSLVSGLLFGQDAERGHVEVVSSALLGAYLFAAGLFVFAQHHDFVAFATFAGLVAATIWIAFRAESASAAVPVAAILVSLVMLDWSLGAAAASGIVPSGPAYYSPIDPSMAANQSHLLVGAGFAALLGASGFLAQGRSERPLPPMLWAASR